MKKPTKLLNLVGFSTVCISTGGERGIRTPGPVTVNSFQDCRIRPLCHFSSKSLSFRDCECKYKNLFWLCKCIFIKIAPFF